MSNRMNKLYIDMYNILLIVFLFSSVLLWFYECASNVFLFFSLFYFSFRCASCVLLVDLCESHVNMCVSVFGCAKCFSNMNWYAQYHGFGTFSGSSQYAKNFWISERARERESVSPSCWCVCIVRTIVQCLWLWCTQILL